MTGDWETAAACLGLLRWGWRPRDFMRLEAAERAFVIAGLQVELELTEKFWQQRS